MSFSFARPLEHFWNSTAPPKPSGILVRSQTAEPMLHPQVRVDPRRLRFWLLAKMRCGTSCNPVTGLLLLWQGRCTLRSPLKCQGLLPGKGELKKDSCSEVKVDGGLSLELPLAGCVTLGNFICGVLGTEPHEGRSLYPKPLA